MKERRKTLVQDSIRRLRGVYNEQQAFNIVLGLLFIKWMEMSKRYGDSVYLITRDLSSTEHTQNSIRYYESDFREIDGILSTLLNKSFADQNINIEEVYRTLDNVDVSTKEEMRELINSAVQYGIEARNFAATPHGIADLVVGLQNLDNVDTFADYCSGVSSIALEVFRRTEHQPYYYAEEINTYTAVISKLLMVINEVQQYEIVNKDIFSMKGNEEFKEFDLVVSDIPRNTRYNRDFNLNDPRFRYGRPRKVNAEWAFIQNVIYHLNHRGKGVVIGSKGMLVRGFEEDIRSRIVKEDLIEAVITLPDNLYEGTNIGTEIIIFNRNKPLKRKDQILFINAHEYGERLSPHQDTITKDGREKILNAYYNNIEEEGFSKIISLDKLHEYDYRLNPVEYIDFEALKNRFEETIPLDRIAKITRGLSLPRKEIEELETQDGYYYISIRNIEEGGINYEEADIIKPKDIDWIGKYSIEPDDILITTKGWETRVAIVGNEFKNSLFSSNLTRIRVNRRIYNPYILVEFLKSEVGKRMLQSIQTGTTITLINNKQLSRMEVPVYPKNQMESIGEAIEYNQKTYNNRVREAEQEYKENRNKLIKELGLDKNS